MTNLVCRAPSVAMEFTPSGYVQACCANSFHPLGNVATSTLSEIWHGPKAMALRSAVARGDLSYGCTVCRHRIAHDEAERPYELYDAFTVPASGELWPQRLSFALHNICNLECVMCGGDRSSRIRSRRDHLPALPRRYGDRFFEELEPFLRHADVFDFNGGEPFLIPEHHRVWDLLGEVRPGASCSVTTNGTVWDARVERVLDAFPTDVRLSMDGITPATFEAIRVGSDLDEVMRNLERFREYAAARGTWLGISFTFVNENWFEMGELMLWAESLGLPVSVQTVIDPRFGVQRRPDAELRLVRDALRCESAAMADRLTINRSEWDRQVGMIEAEVAGRAAGRTNELYMEPPTSDASARVGERIRSAAAEHRLTAIDEDTARRAAEHHVTRWGRGRVDGRAQLDAHTVVLATDLSGLGGGDLSPLPGARISDLVDRLGAVLGGPAWVVEVLVEPAFTVHTLLFAPERRQQEGVIVRLATFPTADGIEVLLGRDDSFAADTEVVVRSRVG